MADDPITATSRALLAVLAPLTGERSSGAVVLQSSGPGSVTVKLGQYAVPVIDGQLSPELLVKVARNPATADGSWVVSVDPTTVDVVSNLGGVRHNLPAGTVLQLDPPVAGLISNRPTVVSPGMLGGADASGFGALLDVAQAESLTGPLLSVDLRRSELQRFPAACLTWTSMLPADGSSVPQVRPGGRTGVKSKLYRLTFVLTVVTSRTDSGSARRHEGRWIVNALLTALSDRQSVDGEVISSPAGVQVQSVTREPNTQGVFQQYYVYNIELNCEVTLTGLDQRTFADWLSARLRAYKPDDALGPIRVVPPEFPQ